MKRNLLFILISALLLAALTFLVLRSTSGKKQKEPLFLTTGCATEAPDLPVPTATEQTSEAPAPQDYTEKQDVIHGIIKPGHVELSLELLYQDPELPSGCEPVSLVMLLNYYGYGLEKTEIADQYLVYSDNFVAGFQGDPRGSGGVYAPGLTLSANNFLSLNDKRYTAKDISGTPLEELFPLLDKGKPVLVWCTINLQERRYGRTVTYGGEEYRWDYNEHCVVLAGYDLEKETLLIYDPLAGVTEPSMEDFRKSYDSMYQMCVILERN